MSVFYSPDNFETIADVNFNWRQRRRYRCYDANWQSELDERRTTRMNDYVDWKRSKIRERVIIHLWVGGAIIFGTPAAIFVGTWLWRFAVDAILQ